VTAVRGLQRNIPGLAPAVATAVQQQIGDLEPTEYHFDEETGQLDGIAQRGRVTTMTYDSLGRVASVTDPEERTVSFTYDAAGRVIEQELPDTRVIAFDYDANGNLTSITPPNQVIHGFTYLPRGQLQWYVPPQPSPALSDPRTLYSYNLSGQLTRITRPDGQRIFHAYDAETGQLTAQVLQDAQSQTIGAISYVYDGGTGNLETATTSTGQIVDYTTDGALPTSESWSVAQGGTGIAGSVGRVFDNSFRVTGQSVNGGSTISFGYDNDDLLTTAGSMSPGRSATTGLLTGTAIANATDAYSYDTVSGPFYGEVTSYTAVVNGSTLYDVDYTRDDLGRIRVKTETVQGTTDTYEYEYNLNGNIKGVRGNRRAFGVGRTA
jgi:YD repeat-containing protein